MIRRWREAIRRRDPAFDGAFVFGVVTTAIYCRPSCPARRPRAKNVRFYATPQAAEREGFRACKRCRPATADRLRPDTALAIRACAELRRQVGLREVALRLAVSPRQLQSLFRRAMGISPRAYERLLRLERFRNAGGDVTSALVEAGFSSPSRLYERARSNLGMTPGTYRKGGAGMTIDYDCIDSPLGRTLIAATPLGICAVEFGDSDAALAKGLKARFPKAQILRSTALLRRAKGLFRRILDGNPAIPLDVRATAFQARVWEELRAIPAGRTRSYGEIARRLGRPSSARAVARACASNPVALLIPCHRAVAADGSLSGYRWGVGRKRALLAREGLTSPKA